MASTGSTSGTLVRTFRANVPLVRDAGAQLAIRIPFASSRGSTSWAK
jgi:hypothetical protein